jgi:hypothetical protein
MVFFLFWVKVKLGEWGAVFGLRYAREDPFCAGNTFLGAAWLLFCAGMVLLRADSNEFRAERGFEI